MRENKKTNQRGWCDAMREILAQILLVIMFHILPPPPLPSNGMTLIKRDNTLSIFHLLNWCSSVSIDGSWIHIFPRALSHQSNENAFSKRKSPNKQIANWWKSRYHFSLIYSFILYYFPFCFSVVVSIIITLNGKEMIIVQWKGVWEELS